MDIRSPEPRVERAVRALPAIAALATATIAVLVLIGWAADVELLKSQMLATAMNPATATAFLLAAASLWFRRRACALPFARGLAIGCAVGVGVIALSRLSAEWIGFDPGLDQILFRRRLVENVMAPNTAMMFALVAIALLLLDVHIQRFPIAQPLLMLAAFGAVFCLAGYLYSESSLIGVRNRIPMALNTAVAFTILIVGIVCVRPDREPVATVTSNTLGGVVARRLFPAAFLVPLLFGWVRLKGEERGMYGRTLGVALFALAIILVFNLLIWWCARVLRRADLAHRRAQELVRASEERYRSILEQAAEGIYLIDMESRRVVDSNNAFDRLLGYARNATIGLTVHDLVGDTVEGIDTRLTLLAKAERPVRAERLYRRRDGSTVEVESSACVVSYGDRSLACTVVRDITERKLAERELHEKNRQLAAAYKAEQDAREQLQRAQSQLVENEKLAGLGQTVAGVAHEINNPLAFVSNNVAVLQRDIKGLCQLLALYQQADPLLKQHDGTLADAIIEQSERVDLAYTIPNIEEVFGRSREGLRRIQQIVKDLRDFARLDEGDPHEVDVNDGVKSTINIVQGRGKQQRVTVEMDLAVDLPRITCQPAKINQVVMNLVANAIDASPEGGHVTVRTARDAEHVLIEVRDQGGGVPPHIRGRIFDPFFTTKPQGQGTGLGLSISYGIIRDHGGSIDVGDASGGDARSGGAVFTVRLPVAGMPVRRQTNRPHGS